MPQTDFNDFNETYDGTVQFNVLQPREDMLALSGIDCADADGF